MSRRIALQFDFVCCAGIAHEKAGLATEDCQAHRHLTVLGHNVLGHKTIPANSTFVGAFHPFDQDVPVANGVSIIGRNRTYTEQPMQNAFVESRNGSLQDELLNESLYSSLVEARDKISAWKGDDNRNRPHSPSGNLTTQAFAMKSRLETKAACHHKDTDGLSPLLERNRDSGQPGRRSAQQTIA